MINTRFILAVLCLFASSWMLGQDKMDYTISGQIQDGTSGEDLISATVFVPELGLGTTSNEYGFYSLTLPEGTYTLKYEYLGYLEVQKVIDLKSDQKMNIELTVEGAVLEELIVTAEEKDEIVNDVSMSKVKLNIETIKKIPTLFGEVDVIKAIQLLPGVATVGEGGSGFYVRGGNVDQNLILLDEAPVYNASHFLGFFSVFNADAIKDMQFYKGAIPASYGGRLSSVIDIRMKDGNSKKFSGSAGLGMIASRLNLEGPIGDKASFMVAGRRTYADLFLRLSKDTTINQNILYFYDLNAKFNYKINENNRIFLSGYSGEDKFGQKNDFQSAYGNRTLTLRWNHLFSQKVFSNLTVYSSSYKYNLGLDGGSEGFDWNSQLVDNGLKYDLGIYMSPRSTLKLGMEGIEHKIDPGKIRGIGSESIFNNIDLKESRALEVAGYISHEYDITNNLRINYGLRYSRNMNMGPDTIYNYNDQYELVDTTIHSGKGVYNTYDNFEPRVGLRYNLNSNTSIKASYNRTAQYIHQATNTTSASPLDVWFLSNPNIKPQLADQFAVGLFKTFGNENDIEASIEGYYKTFKNALDFKDHAQLLLNDNLDGELRFGKAKSYGLELLVRKNKGALTGWIAYTLSKTEKEIERINGGNPYSAKYDHTHDIALVANYELSDLWSISGSWVYKTGAAVTLPTGKYFHLGQVVPVYSERNGERMPAYHRLDLSATKKLNKKLFNTFESSMVFSIYNAYARKNPYSINFRKNDESGKVQAEKTYLFSIIPSFTYNLKF